MASTNSLFRYKWANPEFFDHSPKHAYADHLFILQDNQHFHYISNINGVLKNLRRTPSAEFCFDCFDIKFNTRTHACREEDDTDTKRYQIGNRSLAYFPDRGEDKVIGEQFISRTEPKEDIKALIIYLDFETYVRGKHIESGDVEPLIDLQAVPIDSLIDYEPYPFVERVLDTSQYCYIQVVNHCEVQYEDGRVLTFSSIEETMQWLNLPIHTGAYVIAHCGGGFDFQMILRYFLSDQVLRMKKVKAPLMCGIRL